MLIPRAESKALEEKELGGTHHQAVRALVGEESIDVAPEHPVDQPGVQERRDRGLVAAPRVVRLAGGSPFQLRGHVLVCQRTVLEVFGLLEVGPLVLLRAGLGERRAVPY